MAAAFSGGPTYADNPTFTSAGAYLVNVSIGAQDRNFEFHSAGGVNGSGSKDLGYSGTTITLMVLYVAAGVNDLVGSWKTDTDAIAGGHLDLAVSGSTYKATFLDGGSLGPIKHNGLAATSLYYSYGSIRVTSKRTI